MDIYVYPEIKKTSIEKRFVQTHRSLDIFHVLHVMTTRIYIDYKPRNK